MAFDRLAVSYILIGLNTLVSLFAFARPDIFNAFALQVGPTVNGEYYRILTAGFLHGDIGHLFFNMFTLFFFGPVLENKRALGKQGFLIVYFGSLIVGNLAAVGFHLDNPYYTAVGASGAISGVMLGVSLFVPFMIILIFGIIPMPAILYAVLFVGISAFAMGTNIGGIAHEAHLGGALAGLVITIFVRPQVLNLFALQVSNALSRIGRR